MTAADRPPVNYSYDSAGRLSTISQGSETVTYAYDVLSRLQSLQRPNGVTTSYQYDTAERLKRLTHTGPLGALLEDLQYSYTADNQIEAIDSLASATQMPAAKTASAANRIAQFGQTNYSYDGEGQTTSKADTQTTASYRWDARGRLTGVVLSNGQTISYSYDGFGWRQSRTAGGVTTSFLYDGKDVVRDAVGGSGFIDYLNGPGIDEKIRQTSQNGNLYFLPDHWGGSNKLTNAAGSVVEQRQYEAFGNSSTNAASRYGFTGREQESGANLYHYRARYYDRTGCKFHPSQNSLRLMSVKAISLKPR
jgi:YD repeat-containing protein